MVYTYVKSNRCAELIELIHVDIIYVVHSTAGTTFPVATHMLLSYVSLTSTFTYANRLRCT